MCSPVDIPNIIQAAEVGAAELKAQWEEKISGAEEKAQSILQDASANAERRRAAILDETHAEADRIIRQAESDAELERKKAKAGIRQEIVDVSAALSEKLLGREITADDHRNLIDSFLSEIGEGDGTGK